MSVSLDMCFILGNMVARLALTVFAVGILHYYHDRLNITQRLGLGLMGGMSFLTLPVVYDMYVTKEGTPFDVWVGFLSTVGMLLFMYGTFIRVRRHSIANAQQILQSQRYLRDRGLL